MGSGRTTRILGFTLAALLCVAAGVWLAPRVRTGEATGQSSAAPLDAYRAEPGTALLEVLPPPSPDGGVDAAWQRAVQTHAARVADPAVIAMAVEGGGAVAKTRWGAKKGTPAHAGAVAGVKRALSVRTVPGTALIAVRVDVDSREEAAVLTNALCEAYLAHCRQLATQHAAEQVQYLDRLMEETEKRREDRLAYARERGRRFGADPQLGRERVAAAAARLRRFEEAAAEMRVGAGGAATAPAEARAVKDVEKLAKAAAAELDKVAEELAEFQACHDDALQLAERLRHLREDGDRARRAMQESQSPVRIVVPATVGP